MRVGQARVFGEVRNLTRAGAGLALSVNVPRGQATVELALVDEDSGDVQQSVELTATIVWTAEAAIGRWAAGLRFDPLDPDTAPVLERLLLDGSP